MNTLLLVIFITGLYFCKSEAVKVLTADQFEQFNKLNKLYVIGFFSDKKGTESSETLPIYEEAAVFATKEQLGIPFVRLDVDAYPQLISEWNLEDYPSFFWVDNTKNLKELITVSNYVNFVRGKLGISSIEYGHDLNGLKNITDNYIIAIVDKLDGLDHQNKITKLDKLRHRCGYAKVIVTNAEDVKEKFNKNIGMKLIFHSSKRNTDEEINLADDIFEDEENLIDRLLHLRVAPFSKINEEEIAIIIDEGKPCFILITKEDQDIEFMNEIANKYRWDLYMFNTPYSNPNIALVTEILSIKEENLPFVLITKTNPSSDEDLDKYKFESEFNKENIENFLNDYKEGKLVNYLISEDIPSENPNSNGVYKIVSKNFEEILSLKDKDIVLLVCSRIAKKCSKFSERYLRIIEKFKGNDHILFAETDPNFNEYKVAILNKFPSIIFMPSENIDINPLIRFNNSFIYEGEFTTEKITEFIVQNSRSDVKLNKLINETQIYKEENDDRIEPSGSEDSDFDMQQFFNPDLLKRMNISGDVDMGKIFESMSSGSLFGDLDKLEMMDNEANIKGENLDDLLQGLNKEDAESNSAQDSGLENSSASSSSDILVDAKENVDTNIKDEI